ncbi:hypothetical protein ElyMa_001611100 [Elysia marginata]|uniref:Uncharacterized protein n=1 Tax=Elysia marginata TaxID=1093978 RepID=A0AAV4JNQ2_9GAST|nr:hypothetical protein ElyMa_001611100 [Elysia marginata]
MVSTIWATRLKQVKANSASHGLRWITVSYLSLVMTPKTIVGIHLIQQAKEGPLVLGAMYQNKKKSYAT